MGNIFRHKSNPIPSPIPTTKIIRVIVTDESHNPIRDASTIISITKNDINYQKYMASSDINGIAVITLPFNTGLSSIVTASKDGYESYQGKYDLQSIPLNSLPIQIKSIPQIKPRGRLSHQGKQFYEDGELTRIQGITAFTFYSDYCVGKDLSQFTKQGRDLGANCLRVFASMKNIVNFDPRQSDSDFSKLRKVLDYAKSEGFFVEIGFADLHLIFSNQSEFIPYFKEFIDVISEFDHILFSFVNEPGSNQDNLPDGISDIDKWLDSLVQYLPTNIIYSKGSGYASNGDAIQPVGSYVEIHSERNENIVDGEAEWVRKAKDAWDNRQTYGVPAYNNEPMGAGTHNGRDNTPIRYQKYAALGSLYGHVLFHCDSGILCNIFGETELACAQAFFKGCNAIKVKFLEGAYTRFGPSAPSNPPIKDEEDGKRFYFSILDSEAIGVWITGKNGSDLNASDGWTIKSFDDEKVVYILEKN